MKGVRKSQDREDQPPIAGDSAPRIPGGDYDAICYAVETGVSWGKRLDVYVRFRIADGPFQGVELFMVCPHHPKARLRPRHKYWQQWTLAAERLPVKGERLHFGVFKGQRFRVKVRFTRKRHDDGTPMAACVQYSVVDSIVARLQ